MKLDRTDTDGIRRVVRDIFIRTRHIDLDVSNDECRISGAEE